MEMHTRRLLIVLGALLFVSVGVAAQFEPGQIGPVDGNAPGWTTRPSRLTTRRSSSQADDALSILSSFANGGDDARRNNATQRRMCNRLRSNIILCSAHLFRIDINQMKEMFALESILVLSASDDDEINRRMLAARDVCARYSQFYTCVGGKWWKCINLLDILLKSARIFGYPTSAIESLNEVELETGLEIATSSCQHVDVIADNALCMKKALIQDTPSLEFFKKMQHDMKLLNSIDPNNWPLACRRFVVGCHVLIYVLSSQCGDEIGRVMYSTLKSSSDRLVSESSVEECEVLSYEESKIEPAQWADYVKYVEQLYSRPNGSEPMLLPPGVTFPTLPPNFTVTMDPNTTTEMWLPPGLRQPTLLPQYTPPESTTLLTSVETTTFTTSEIIVPDEGTMETTAAGVPSDPVETGSMNVVSTVRTILPSSDTPSPISSSTSYPNIEISTATTSSTNPSSASTSTSSGVWLTMSTWYPTPTPPGLLAWMESARANSTTTTRAMSMSTSAIDRSAVLEAWISAARTASFTSPSTRATQQASTTPSMELANIWMSAMRSEATIPTTRPVTTQEPTEHLTTRKNGFITVQSVTQPSTRMTQKQQEALTTFKIDWMRSEDVSVEDSDVGDNGNDDIAWLPSDLLTSKPMRSTAWTPPPPSKNGGSEAPDEPLVFGPGRPLFPSQDRLTNSESTIDETQKRADESTSDASDRRSDARRVVWIVSIALMMALFRPS